jgi:hypothetical protein
LLGAAVSGRARGNGAAKGSLSPSTAASARLQAGARGQGIAGALSTLFGSARTAGAAVGRAAPSPAAALSGRSTPSVRSQTAPGLISLLRATGATRGAAAGQAAMAVSAAISASTISRGAMRSGLSAGTALTAVVRFSGFGQAINGDQNPLFFDVGHVATISVDARFAVIPADNRLAALPVDVRAVTVSGASA